MITFLGCGPAPRLFYWGTYSSTLYNYKKNPDEKTLAAHKASLLNVITESPKRNKKIPPGICAEYGYLLAKEGNNEKGLEYMDKEIELYPESKTFIQRLKSELLRGEK
jgi:hypothetical protein